MMKERDRILIADDDPTNIAIIEELLGDNYEVKTVSTGPDVLEVILDFRPALILLDIMMPGLDGYEVCRRIRMTPSLMSTRVIVVSGKAMVSERLKGYQAGADDYVVKPFDTDELLAKVRVYLRMQSVREAKEFKDSVLSAIYNKTQGTIETVMQSVQKFARDEELDANQRKSTLESINTALRELQDFFEEVTPDTIPSEESARQLQGSNV